MNYFPNIVGQRTVKNQLGFQLEAYRSTSFLAPICMVAKRGAGKTDIMRGMREHLTDEKKQPKPFVEINGASLKNPSGLVNKAFIPYQNRAVTYFIDEVHAMHPSVQEFMLSVISPNVERKAKTHFDGMDLEFDFLLQSFLFATTDPQKLSPAFKSRCRRIDLEPYSDKNIAEVLNRHAARIGVVFRKDVEIEVATVCRNTPREAVKILDDIRQFCDVKRRKDFNFIDWTSLRKTLNILPLGLNSSEHQVLRLLGKHGEMSLTHISNSLAMKRGAVQGDIEPFLMEKNLIRIDGKRHITALGLEVLNSIDNE